MHVYDFDKTIYAKDSSLQFYLFCLRQRPGILKALPHQLLYFVKYLCKRCTKEQFKSAFFSFFKMIDVNAQAEVFWSKEFDQIRSWYLAQKQADDVIVSASPQVLLQPVCRRLGVHLIATVVDANGVIHGQNCYGAEKVARFRHAYPAAEIDTFYSDSRSDHPLARAARKAFLVKEDRIIPW